MTYRMTGGRPHRRGRQENIDMTATHVRATTAALMIIVLVSALWAGVSAAERASHGAEGGIGIVTKSDESVAACFIGEEIAPELRQALGALADKAWTMLEKQDWDGLRKLSGADETRSGSKDAFVEGLTEAAERLGRPIDAAADELFVFRFSGAFSGVAVCGAADAADPKLPSQSPYPTLIFQNLPARLLFPSVAPAAVRTNHHLRISWRRQGLAIRRLGRFRRRLRRQGLGGLRKVGRSAPRFR
jgi:hypothetical protein